MELFRPGAVVGREGMMMIKVLLYFCLWHRTKCITCALSFTLPKPKPRVRNHVITMPVPSISVEERRGEGEWWDEVPQQGIMAAGRLALVAMGLGEFSEYKISDEFGRHQSETSSLRRVKLISDFSTATCSANNSACAFLTIWRTRIWKFRYPTLTPDGHLALIEFLTSNLTLTCSSVTCHLRKAQSPLASIRRLQIHSYAQRPPRVHLDPKINNNTHLLSRNPSSLWSPITTRQHSMTSEIHSCAWRPPCVHQDPDINNNTDLLSRNLSSSWNSIATCQHSKASEIHSYAWRPPRVLQDPDISRQHSKASEIRSYSWRPPRIDRDPDIKVDTGLLAIRTLDGYTLSRGLIVIW